MLRRVYAACLLGAASTHVLTVATHGLFWNYGGASISTSVFWTSLTFLDPLAALLLFVKPRIGVLLTLVIIVSDVMHNTWLMSRSTLPDWSNWMYVSQVVFLLFVLLSASQAWKIAHAEPEPNHSFNGDAAKATHRWFKR
jgi:hypothetical protein